MSYLILLLGLSFVGAFILPMPSLATIKAKIRILLASMIRDITVSLLLVLRLARSIVPVREIMLIVGIVAVPIRPTVETASPVEL